MDIMELGAIGELVGGVAVVASLIFVGVQIRTQIREQRLAATRDLSAQFSIAAASLVEDPEFTRIYRQGLQNFESLQDDERLRVSVFMARVVRCLEQQFLHSQHSRVDPSYFEGMSARLRGWFAEPGVQQWWRINGPAFSAAFRARADRVIENATTTDDESAVAEAPEV